MQNMADKSKRAGTVPAADDSIVEELDTKYRTVEELSDRQCEFTKQTCPQAQKEIERIRQLKGKAEDDKAAVCANP